MYRNRLREENMNKIQIIKQSFLCRMSIETISQHLYKNNHCEYNYFRTLVYALTFYFYIDFTIEQYMKIISLILASLIANVALSGNVVIGNGNCVKGNGNLINHGDGNNIEGDDNRITEGIRNQILGNLNQLFRQNNLNIQGDGFNYGTSVILPVVNPNLSSDFPSPGCNQ